MQTFTIKIIFKYMLPYIPHRGGSRNSSAGGGGVLGRNSSGGGGGRGPGPREFSYTDKQNKKTSEGV